MAQLGNSVVIAIGYISYIYYFVNRSGKGIGRGVQSIITRNLGKGDYKKSNNVAVSGILIVIILSIIIQLFIFFVLPSILGYIKNKSSIPLIISYMNCLSIFMFPILITEYMTEILNAEANTKTATNIMVVGIIINIILDYVFICVLKVGIVGASLGTSLSYIGTFIILFYSYILKDNYIIKIKFREFKLDFEVLKEIIINSLPIILDSFVVTLSGLVVIVFLGFLVHPIIVVAFNFMNRFQGFIGIPQQGLSRSCNIVVGHLFGAKRIDDVKKTIKSSIKISLSVSIIISLFLALTLNFFARFFTQNKGVCIIMYYILPVIVLQVLCLAFAYNINQSLIAIGYSKYAFYSLVFGLMFNLTFIMLLCYGLSLGAVGIFTSWILSEILEVILSYILLNRVLNDSVD